MDSKLELIDFLAGGLSNQPALDYDCNQFYSMAQHNLILAEYLPPTYTMNCLLFNACCLFINYKKEKAWLGMRFAKKHFLQLDNLLLGAFSAYSPQLDLVQFVNMRLTNAMLLRLTPFSYKTKFYDVAPLKTFHIEIIENKTYIKELYFKKFMEVVKNVRCDR